MSAGLLDLYSSELLRCLYGLKGCLARASCAPVVIVPSLAYLEPFDLLDRLLHHFHFRPTAPTHFLQLPQEGPAKGTPGAEDGVRQGKQQQGPRAALWHQKARLSYSQNQKDDKRDFCSSKRPRRSK